MKAIKLVLIAAAGVLLLAQNPGVQRTVVQRKDISVPGREAVIAHVEIAPGASVGRHTHPGEEISYVMEGEGKVLIHTGTQPLQEVPESSQPPLATLLTR